MRRGALFALAALCLVATPALADPFDDMVAARRDFSGAVLVVKDGAIVFDKAYGLADVARGTPNRTSTRFHIGSASMPFTDLAILRLANIGKLSLDNTAGQFLPDLAAPDHDRPIRNLVGSGNPADHILLARIAAAATGKPFAEDGGAGAAIFASVLETGSGWDDGSLSGDSHYAVGYDAAGHPAKLDWAAILGADGVYSTTRDMLRLVDWKALEAIPVPHSDQESVILNASRTPSLGRWRIGTAYEIDGRDDGFTMAVLAQLDSPVAVTVVVLSNHDRAPASDLAWNLATVARKPAR